MERQYEYGVSERDVLTQAFRQKFSSLSISCDSITIEEMVVEVEDFYYELLRIQAILLKIESI